jgi:hypothetical protein
MAFRKGEEKGSCCGSLGINSSFPSVLCERELLSLSLSLSHSFLSRVDIIMPIIVYVHKQRRGERESMGKFQDVSSLSHSLSLTPFKRSKRIK